MQGLRKKEVAVAAAAVGVALHIITIRVLSRRLLCTIARTLPRLSSQRQTSVQACSIQKFSSDGSHHPSVGIKEGLHRDARGRCLCKKKTTFP